MPRKARMYLPGIPCHVIQRGNDRKACFFSDIDYRFYLSLLKDACCRYKVALHAYVLMTNHAHLILTPSDEIGISRVMQSLGRCYVQTINKIYHRTGTLWEGRHISSLIDAEDYLLRCYRYIELNPVRAKMVDHPADYFWSSFRAHAYGEENKFLTDHDVYLNLHSNPEKRQKVYLELFKTALSKDFLNDIRKAAFFSMPLGSSIFKAQIEKKLERNIGYSKRGRPRGRLGKCK